jgi:hypothetical protein
MTRRAGTGPRPRHGAGEEMSDGRDLSRVAAVFVRVKKRLLSHEHERGGRSGPDSGLRASVDRGPSRVLTRRAGKKVPGVLPAT